MGTAPPNTHRRRARCGAARHFALRFAMFGILAPAVAAQESPPAPVSDFLGLEAEPFQGPIATERPSFSTSPLPLASGHYQIESGLLFTQLDDGAEAFTLPQALLRVGLARNLELQIGWAGYTFADAEDGASDITLALKTQIVEQTGIVPALGLIGQLSLPTGSEETSSNSVDPTLGVLWTYGLQRNVGLFGTALVGSTTGEEDDRLLQGSIAAGVGFPLSDRLNSYVEYFGAFSEHNDPKHIVNTALLYLLNYNLQLDTVIGAGLNDAAPDYFIGGGVSYRW